MGSAELANTFLNLLGNGVRSVQQLLACNEQEPIWISSVLQRISADFHGAPLLMERYSTRKAVFKRSSYCACAHILRSDEAEPTPRSLGTFGVIVNAEELCLRAASAQRCHIGTLRQWPARMPIKDR